MAGWGEEIVLTYFMVNEMMMRHWFCSRGGKLVMGSLVELVGSKCNLLCLPACSSPATEVITSITEAGKLHYI